MDGTAAPEVQASPDLPKGADDVDLRKQAVSNVARGSKHPEDLADATAWFLSDADAGVTAHRTFQLNVSANPDEPHWVTWTVQALSREQIRSIQRLSRPARQRASAQGEVDGIKANLGLAAEGTSNPDLDAIARDLGTQDKSDVLRRRFAHKPGLIDQIAQEVLTVSGYDDEDVRDVTAVKT